MKGDIAYYDIVIYIYIERERQYNIVQYSIVQQSIVQYNISIHTTTTTNNNNDNDKHNTITDADLVGLRFEGLVGAWNLKWFGCP